MTAVFPIKDHTDSESDSWCTAREIALAVGYFGTDPCSNAHSHIRSLRRYCLPDDGLALPWIGSVWCNPPYSRPLPWALRLAAHTGPWVALVKLDPTTQWYRVLTASCTGVANFRVRIKFERPGKAPLTANFPSILFWRDWDPPVALRPMLWLGDRV